MSSVDKLVFILIYWSWFSWYQVMFNVLKKIAQRLLMHCIYGHLYQTILREKEWLKSNYCHCSLVMYIETAEARVIYRAASLLPSAF